MNFSTTRCLTLLFAAAFAATTTGCGRHETPVEIANRENILLVSSGGDPSSLDPQLIQTLNDSHITMALYEGLTIPDPVTLEPRPGVAKSWDYDDKTLTWTFHLRPEAKWSNGDPVTAQDFVFSFHRILNPMLGVEYATMLYPIKNAKDFNEGKQKDFSKVGVKALDDHTLQIQLEHPTGYFLELCYHQTYLPVHPPTIMKFNAMNRRDSGWDKPATFVGNGPFVLTKYVLGEIIELKKNPLYWNADKIRLNGIKFYPIADVNAEERAFRNGALHITSTLPPPRISAYRDTHSPFLRVMPVYGNYFYTINTRKPALNDPRVRRALNMAIDRQALVDHVTRGGQVPAYTLTPASALYKPTAQIQENVAEAKRLLAEGANLCIWDLSPQGLAAAADALGQSDRVSTEVVDVTSEAAVMQLRRSSLSMELPKVWALAASPFTSLHSIPQRSPCIARSATASLGSTCASHCTATTPNPLQGRPLQSISVH